MTARKRKPARKPAREQTSKRVASLAARMLAPGGQLDELAIVLRQAATIAFELRSELRAIAASALTQREGRLPSAQEE